MSKQRVIREFIKTVLDGAGTGLDAIYSSFHLPDPDQAKNFAVIYDNSEEASEPLDKWSTSERTIALTIEVIAQTTDGDIDALIDGYCEKIEKALGPKFWSNGDKPYTKLFYRGRQKSYEAAGQFMIGGAEMRFTISYDFTA